MNKHELYHSEIYLGKDFSDGFKHYKYLKKVKSASGKWRYIYDESDIKNTEKKIEKSVKLLSDKDGHINYTDKNGNHVSKNLTEGYTIRTGSSWYGNKQTKKDEYIERKTAELESTIRAHEKQKIKDIPKKLISKAIGAVGSILSKIENNWINTKS